MKLNYAILLVFFVFSIQDSFGQGATEYTGKRMHLSSVKLVSESKKNLKISLIISNTGRQDIRLYDGLNLETVVFTFGVTFDGQFSPYKERILNKLIASHNTLIRAGQLYTPKSFKIKKLSKEDTSKVEPYFKEVVPKKNQTVTDSKETKSEEDKEEKSVVNTKNEEEKAVVNAKKEKPKKSKKQRTMSPIGELPKPEASNKCFDLVVEDLEVIRSSKKNIYLRFNLINYGEGVFKFDKKNSRYDNLSIKAFFASIPRLTRGSLIVGGEHFDDLFDEKTFELGFGEKISGTMRVPLEKMTKFTPVIILELDPFSAILECDKVNNVTTVLWKGN